MTVQFGRQKVYDRALLLLKRQTQNVLGQYFRYSQSMCNREDNNSMNTSRYMCNNKREKMNAC